MAKETEAWEWRIDGMSKLFVSESMPRGSGFAMALSMKCWGLIQKGWEYGMSEPQKVIHCFKVGMALCLVSLFYYINPLYEGVGGNAMWAVLTVVVAFEYTVGMYSVLFIIRFNAKSIKVLIHISCLKCRCNYL